MPSPPLSRSVRPQTLTWVQPRSDNAIRHSPEQGEIRLSAARHDGRARLVVADEGPGVSPDHLDTIWERFHHVPGERSPVGAGLGLAIVREIIEQHGGEVFAESEVGQGSTFGFDLPLADDGSD